MKTSRPMATETQTKSALSRLFWKWPVLLLLFGSLIVEARGQVVDANRSSPGLVSAYESVGDNVVKIALYKKTGNEFKVAAIAEVKGRISFNSEGIISGVDTIRRLQLAETQNRWLSITDRKLVGGRAVITTEDGNTYTVFNLGIGAFAGQVELGCVIATSQDSSSGMIPGVYKGEAEEVSTFTVTLVSTNDTIKVLEVGYKFSGSLEVEHAFLKGRKPFGTTEKNKLLFQFPVFVKFSPSPSLTINGGSTSMAYYSAEIAKTDAPDELKCKLNQIDKLDKEYEDEGFTFKDIGLRTPDKKMQKDYTITLKLAEKKEAPQSSPTDFVDPNEAKAIAKARKLIDQKNFDQAIVVCKQSLDKNPKDGEMLLLLGIAYYQKAQFDDALSSFNQVIEVDPKRAEAYFQRGLTFAFRPERDVEKAMADFTKAIELDPRHSKAYLNRGNIYALNDSFTKAIEDFTKTVELDPTSAAAYFNRGMIYDKTMQTEKAIADYSKAIELDPKYLKAYLNRGSSYADGGQFEKARRDFQKVLELDPNGRAGEIARDNLSKIKEKESSK